MNISAMLYTDFNKEKYKPEVNTMQPSSELMSQLVPKRYTADFLSRWCLKPEWEARYRAADLEVEFWANGLWVKQCGLIKYRSFANFVIYTSNMRAISLQTKKVSKTITLVQGTQKPWYAVYQHPSGYLKCECMLYRSRASRLGREVPVFLKALEGKIFCHHTAAVETIKFV
jgi:hypothetical protein